MAEVSALLREMIGATRQLLAATQQLLENSRQQLELSKRWEQRTVEQQQVQRDDFTRLMKDHPALRGRSKEVEAAISEVLGKSLSDLFEYVDHHGSDMSDSDYVRSELVDKYGGMLYHLHGIHGIVKRLSMLEQQQQNAQKPPGAG